MKRERGRKREGGREREREKEEKRERCVPSPGLLTNAWMEARSLELSQVLPHG